MYLTCYDKDGAVLEEDITPSVNTLADVDPSVLPPGGVDVERAAPLVVPAVHLTAVPPCPLGHYPGGHVAHNIRRHLDIIAELHHVTCAIPWAGTEPPRILTSSIILGCVHPR